MSSSPSIAVDLCSNISSLEAKGVNRSVRSVRSVSI
ncbi:hypothetical protein CCACVL1_07807 [Corchorus capsularis]|uniref:Uncharacterized protein n=1 Tax=Corchorus capsularis TaxID=210143 RepID=A0A1R3J3R9_COCAP|nr:hypothetical protein CCACVL1_07807 [Corchorus capsularis]